MLDQLFFQNTCQQWGESQAVLKDYINGCLFLLSLLYNVYFSGSGKNLKENKVKGQVGKMKIKGIIKIWYNGWQCEFHRQWLLEELYLVKYVMFKSGVRFISQRLLTQQPVYIYSACRMCWVKLKMFSNGFFERHVTDNMH